MNPEDENERIRSDIRSVYPPLLLLTAVGLLIYWAYGYGETARQLPVLVGTGTAILVVLDILSRLHGKVAAVIRSVLGAGFQDRELTLESRWQSEIIQFVWMFSCVVGIVFIGILATVPAFVLMYMFIQGKQSLLFSMTISLVVLVLVGLVFEVLLDYELHRGLLFDQGKYD